MSRTWHWTGGGTYAPGGLGLVPMNRLKQALELHLKLLVLVARVELADKVTAGLERVAGEAQRRSAESLEQWGKRGETVSFLSD